MAFKKAKVRYRTKRIVRYARRSGNFLNHPIVKGLLYGLIRQPVKNGINGVVRKLPVVNKFTGISDEVVLLGTASVVSKFSKKGAIHDMARFVQGVEAVNVGQQTNIGNLTNMFSSTAAATSASSTNNGGATF